MKYTFDNERPIYLQIVDIITKEITNGIIKPGQKILSVREYAMEFKVNPNTISKALMMLENDALIITERTNGKFVTSNLEVINKHKETIIKDKINSFIEELSQLGLSKEEVIKMLKEN